MMPWRVWFQSLFRGRRIWNRYTRMFPPAPNG